MKQIISLPDWGIDPLNFCSWAQGHKIHFDYLGFDRVELSEEDLTAFNLSFVKSNKKPKTHNPGLFDDLGFNSYF